METPLTPTADKKNPAEDKSEEAKEEEAVDEPMETFTKPMVEDTTATDTLPPPVTPETSPILEPGGHKPASKDIVTTHVVIQEQNRKIPNNNNNNHAAQVQGTHSKIGASLTDDDDAFTERAVPFEPDPPEVTREDTKCVCDPESEPTDKLYMTATAWDKIHVLADMASNEKIQCVQPFRMRKPNENEKGVCDKFYGSSANNMTQIHNIAKDGVAYEFLLFDPDGQFNKYRPAAEMIRLLQQQDRHHR